MRVYRYLSKRELKNILENNINNIGSHFSSKNHKENTHRYHEDERYIHFYKNAESMQDIRSLYREYNNEFYFCSFEIPRSVLFVCRGKGFYPAHGYEENFSTLTEYAVPVSMFNPSWLSGFLIDKERNKIITSEKYAKMFSNNTNEEKEQER